MLAMFQPSRNRNGSPPKVVARSGLSPVRLSRDGGGGFLADPGGTNKCGSLGGGTKCQARRFAEVQATSLNALPFGRIVFVEHYYDPIQRFVRTRILALSLNKVSNRPE